MRIDIKLEALDEVWKRLIRIIEAKWYERSTIISLDISFFVIILYFFKGSTYNFHIAGSVCVFVSVVWFLQTRIPKAPSKAIGFGVAIVAYRKEQRERLARDFVDTLKELLSRGRQIYPFAVIEFPQHYAKKIFEGDDINKYLKKSNCKFLIYGRAREDIVQGRMTHVLSLEGIVTHQTIPEDVQQQFVDEFAELLPRKLHLLTEDGLLQFELTSELINVVARYIIGIASLLSRDPDYSQSLFEGLKEDLSRLRLFGTSVDKLRRRIPLRLIDVYTVQGYLAYERWKNSRSREDLNNLKTYADKIKGIQSSNYEAAMLSSIYHFVSSRDIQAAKSELRAFRRSPDETWRFNLAFLNAYEENMQAAERNYKNAARGQYTAKLIFDLEDFISWLLDVEPEKLQLYYCLGLINYFAKEDNLSAKHNFETFLATVSADRFQEEQTRAREYLGAIDRDLEEAGSTAPIDVS